MSKNQQGFTLIELVMVIVILGILAATAIPKFVDLSSEAEAAALDSLIGVASSAMAVNYAACSAVGHGNGVATATGLDQKCITVNSCDDVVNVTQDWDATDYTVATTALSSNGAVADCVVTQTSTSNTGTFTGIGAGQ